MTRLAYVLQALGRDRYGFIRAVATCWFLLGCMLTLPFIQLLTSGSSPTDGRSTPFEALFCITAVGCSVSAGFATIALLREHRSRRRHDA
jgi:hypothetical protein